MVGLLVKCITLLIISFSTCDGTRKYNELGPRKMSSGENVYLDKAKPSGWIDPFDMGIKPPSTETKHNNFKQSSDQHYVDIVPPKPGWVDPFAMLGESHSSDLLVLSDVEKHVLAKRLTNCEVYARRFTNLFLNALKSQESVKHGPSSVQVVNLEFLIDDKEMQILHDFGSRSKDGNLEKVSDTLTNIFMSSKNKGSCSNMNDFLAPIQSFFLKLAQSPEWSVCSSIFLLLFLTLWFAWRHSFRFATFTLFLTLFLCGFGFTWLRMIEEKEIERFAKLEQHGNVPYHCGRLQLPWYEHMYYRMFGEDCVKFYQARDVRPMVKISPTVALAETISVMIVEPSKNIGIAYGSFITSVTDAVPWYVKGVGVVMGCLVPVFFLTVLLAFLCGYNLSLSWTGFHVYPSWFNSSAPRLSGNNEKYVEDLSKKEIERKSSYEAVMNNSSEAVFLMNWKGIQKLASSTLLKVDEDEKKESPKDSRALVKTEDDSNIKSLEEASDATHEEESCRKRSGNIDSNNDKSAGNIESYNESDPSSSEDQLVRSRIRKSLDTVNKQEIKEKTN